MKEKQIETVTNSTQSTILNENVRSKRILGYDFARALAILGMILVNYKVVLWDWHSGPQWLSSLLKVLEGKAAAAFVVLAGAGMSLMVRKAFLSNDMETVTKQRNVLLKRALFLLIGGLLYTPLWPGDILHYYGIFIACGALLLTAGSRWFFILSGAAIGIWVILFNLIDYSTGWNFSTLTYLDMWTVNGMIRNLFYNGFHPVFPWIGFLLFGMWLGRQDLQNGDRRKKIMIISLVIMLAAEFEPRIFALIVSPESLGMTPAKYHFLLGTSPMPPLPLYMLSGMGTAAVVICLSIQLTGSIGNKRWIMPFIHAGQWALTIYVAHVIIGIGIVEGFGKLNSHSIQFVAVYSILFTIASTIVAHLCRKRFQRGPMEWLMRKITG